jgi:hypothetical protein
MAHAMSSAVQAVELACSIAGTTAFRATSPLERCFRDVQTMRHHVFASEQRYGTFGQVYLGVEPDLGLHRGADPARDLHLHCLLGRAGRGGDVFPVVAF